MNSGFVQEKGTCFRRVEYKLADLLQYIDLGDIGLPDIQRPFKWENTKVRDLFDSMYKGFPVGSLLFWINSGENGVRRIGLDTKQHAPARLIVDGQQRLTSLYAVFRAKKVLDEDYKERQIEIAFRPRDGKFEVADAAVRRDPEFIPNISVIWASGKSSHRLINEFLTHLSEKAPLTDDEEEAISNNLDRLLDLQHYPFTAQEIAPTVEEEAVADIFVRINSQGTSLDQADFILTLMSVFWDEGRAELERFCRTAREPVAPGGPASSFNHFIAPMPDQLLRVAVAVAFRRGRLKSVYQLLRGKDMSTGLFSPERREEQFLRLGEAQAKMLDLIHWHQFFNALMGAGFPSGELITSSISLVYTYALYLIGRTEFDVPTSVLQRVIGRWFYAVTLSRRYTGSFESAVDQDLNRLQGAHDVSAFVETLDRIIASELTGDFWEITLPNELEISAARHPAISAFFAAQVKLDAPALFSDRKVRDLFDPTLRPKKKSLDRHHLYPKAFLESFGIEDRKLINQAANLALVEWPEDIEISDAPPAEYVPRMRQRFSQDEWVRMHDLHGLPLGWETLEYSAFLSQRRKLMAGVIRRGFDAVK